MKIPMPSSYVTHDVTSLRFRESAFAFRIKWRMFMLGLVAVVLLEVLLIAYAGFQIYPISMSAAPSNGTFDNYGNVGNGSGGMPWLVIRSMVLDPKGEVDKDAQAAVPWPDNVTVETFLRNYAATCAVRMESRSRRPDVRFKQVFDAILRYVPAAPAAPTVAATLGTAVPAPSNNTVNDTRGYTDANLAPSQDLPAGTSSNLAPCPCVPDTLTGPINVTFNAPFLGELELMHDELDPGGQWQPRDCDPRHQTAIIIPFRDREEHLSILLHHLHPMLQRQQIAYRVFVIEQGFPEVFNKAAMMNVGFREAAAASDFDCFVFHDVDMVPEDDRNFYTCTPFPRHVGSHCDKFNYKVPYLDIFGGVTAFTREQFQAVNGFSNTYYGWGGEDDDMRRRIHAGHLDIVRFPGVVARYTMIKHGPDLRNPYNSRSGVSWRYRPAYYVKEGLTTLEYGVRRLEQRTLYTWILAEIPPAPPGGFVHINRKAARAGASAPAAHAHGVFCVTALAVSAFLALFPPMW